MTTAGVDVRGFVGRWWRSVTAVAPQPGVGWPALRVGLCVAVPLVLTVATGHVDWAPYAVFGSLNAVYGKQLQYRARLRAQAVVGVALVVAVAAGTAIGAAAPGSALAVVAMAAFSVLGWALAHRWGLRPVPSLFLVLALGMMSSYGHPWSDLGVPLLLTAASASMSSVLGQLGRYSPASRRPRSATPTVTPMVVVLRSPADTLEPVAYLLGPLIAGGLALAVGVDHPYWAAVAATAPFADRGLAAQMARGTLRVLGTCGGVVIAFVMIEPATPAWVLVVAVVVLQTATELAVLRNYGIAVLCITPMALILSHLGDPEPVLGLLRDRVLETCLGVCVSIAVLAGAWLLPPRQREVDNPLPQRMGAAPTEV